MLPISPRRSDAYYDMTVLYYWCATVQKEIDRYKQDSRWMSSRSVCPHLPALLSAQVSPAYPKAQMTVNSHHHDGICSFLRYRRVPCAIRSSQVVQHFPHVRGFLAEGNWTTTSEPHLFRNGCRFPHPAAEVVLTVANIARSSCMEKRCVHDKAHSCRVDEGAGYEGFSWQQMVIRGRIHF